MALSQKPVFEVASIKLAPPDYRSLSRTGGPGSSDPTRFTCNNCSLSQLTTDAWGLRYFEISGPSWLEQQRFMVTAKLLPGTAKDQFLLMQQALLEERFGLKPHVESRETAGYELLLARNGPRLTASIVAPADPDAPPSAPRPLKFGKDGLPAFFRPAQNVRNECHGSQRPV